MKLKKIISTAFLGSLFYSLVCSIVSCNYSTQKLVDLDFTKTIIKNESINNLIKRLENSPKSIFKKNISEKEFEKEMKQILREELIIDENSLIYKELDKLNKIEEFKKQYINETYDSLIEEIKNETTSENARHWVGIFQSHSWESIVRKLQAMSLNLLAISDLTLQLAPSIIFFIKYGDTQALVDSLSLFDGKLTSITKWLFVKGIEDLRNWKINTKCKSNFFVWGQIL